MKRKDFGRGREGFRPPPRPKEFAHLAGMSHEQMVLFAYMTTLIDLTTEMAGERVGISAKSARRAVKALRDQGQIKSVGRRRNPSGSLARSYRLAPGEQAHG